MKRKGRKVTAEGRAVTAEMMGYGGTLEQMGRFMKMRPDSQCVYCLKLEQCDDWSADKKDCPNRLTRRMLHREHES